MMDDMQQADPWAIVSEAPAASQSQQSQKPPADPWAVVSEQPAAAPAPQAPATPPASSAPADTRPGAGNWIMDSLHSGADDMRASIAAKYKAVKDIASQASGGVKDVIAPRAGATRISGAQNVLDSALRAQDLAGRPVVEAGTNVVTGARDVFTETDAEKRARSGGAPMTDAESSAANNRAIGGAAKMIVGGGSLLLMADMPGVASVTDTAITGTGLPQQAAQAAIAKMAAHFGIGAVAGEGAGAVADHYKASPEVKAFVQALAFFTPALAGMAGIKTAAVNTPEGMGVGGSAFGGSVSAKAGVTPEAYGAAVKLGDTQFGVRIPRAPRPPTAAEVTAQSLLSGNVEAMRQSAQADAAAAAIVAGATPEEAVAAQTPKPPPTISDQAAAQMFPTPVIQQHHMTAAAEIIKSVPPEQQGAATLQAHDQLAAQIAKWTTFVGPDGKTYTNNGPNDPAKFASQFINAEVDRHDSTIAEAQKGATTAVAPPPAPGDAPQPTGKPGKSKLQTTADDAQYARAKTVIESSDSPQAAVQAMGLAGIPADKAQGFIQRHQAEQVAANTPTVGSGDEPVVEESRATVDAQMEALKAGTIKTVMLPAGSKYKPAIPPGMSVLDVKGNSPGAGRYIYDPAKLNPSTIREAAKAGTHGVLMGHLSSKEELENAPETVAVVAHKKDGTEIQSSETPATVPHVQAQAAVMAERHPDAELSVKPTDDVIGDRIAAQQAGPEDPWALVSEAPRVEITAGDSEAAKDVVEGGGPIEAATKQQKESGKAPAQEGGGLAASPPSAVPEEVKEHKYDFGSTQANVPKTSAASGAVDAIRAKIDAADLAGDGIDIDENHVTVRYGVQGDDLDGIRKFLKAQTPFDVTLGSTTMFPPNKAAILSGNEKPAAVVIASVESPEFHRLNEEIADHGDFKASDFPDYKPHVTIAYVKPEAAKKYVGLDDAKGKTFRVDTISISDRDGKIEDVKLEGNTEASKFVKGDRVKFRPASNSFDVKTGVIKHELGGKLRITGDGGGSFFVPKDSVTGSAPTETQAIDLKPGESGNVPVGQLHLDPKRFQYKLDVGAEGVSDLLDGKKWNADLAGVVSVWRDPANGKTYIVNGHHRAVLAKQTQARTLLVRMLDSKTAAEARATGALQNIADGRGTALDAAKFFRDSGHTIETVEAKGISMGEATARNGLALSHLDGRIFNMVVQGKMGQGRAIAIGAETSDPATQDVILKLIDKAEKKGQRVTDGTVGELARFAESAPLRQETVASLFGNHEETHSTALDKAQVSSFVKRELSAEKRVFGAVATDARAKTLAAEGKNKIDAKGNAEKATSAEQALAVYDKLSARRGTIDDILNRAAGERANAKPAAIAAIDQQAYEDIRADISGTLAGELGQSLDGNKENSGRGSKEEVAPALPGLEDAVKEQDEAALEHKSDADKQAAEGALASTKGDISKTTGDLERNSPLFFGSDATEQNSLFAQGEHRIHGAPDGFYVEPARGNDAPMLRVSIAVARTINNFTRTTQNPVGIIPKRADAEAIRGPQIDTLLARLKMSGKPENLELAKALKSARSKDGNLIIVRHGMDYAKGEEQFHGLQFAHYDTSVVLVERMATNPLISKSGQYMAERGGYVNDPFTALLESTAKIANGEWEKTGLTKEESTEVLTEFLTGYVDRLGISVLDSIPEVSAHGRSIVENIRRNHGSASKSRQNDEPAGDARVPAGAASEYGEPDSGGVPRRELRQRKGLTDRVGDVGPAGPREIPPQQQVTDTPTFKKWFGDSVVQGASGHPLVVYHGTSSDFDTFNGSKLGSNTDHATAKAGFFFSDDPDATAEFHGETLDPSDYTFKPDIGSNIMPVYLSIERPLTLDAGEYHDLYLKGGDDFAAVVRQAKEDGHDGILIEANKAVAEGENSPESGADTWVAFKRGQIKSAIGNNGEFNPKKPSILQSRGEFYKASGIIPSAIKAISKIKPAGDAVALLEDKAERVRVSRDLHNRLYDLASQDNAAVLRTVQMLKQMPGTAKDQQAIYHYLEDPTAPLTSEQQDILDNHLTPLIHQAEHDFQVVSEGGVPLENYVHRQVRDRDGMIDKLIERVKDGKPSSGVGGGRLSKAAPAAKHRTMMAIQDAATGKRQVVSIKGGRVTLLKHGKPPQDIGPLVKGLTTVGEDAEAAAAPYVKQVTELRHEIQFAKSADHAEQLKDVQERIATLRAKAETLNSVKVRTGTSKGDMFGPGRAQYSTEATFNQRAQITRDLQPLLAREEAIKAGTAPMLAKNTLKLFRRKESLKDAEAARDHFMNELPVETFEHGAWKGQDGKLQKITQATTKEIEASTDVRYYQNAAASVAVNYLAMDKARRAYEFLENFKNSPEFAEGSHSLDSPGAIPKGWKTTQLPQLRGYFFEPHIAEVLDTYAKQAGHEPGVVEKLGNFLRNSIFFNPLIHVPNLLNHWVVEKGVSSVLNPLAYPRTTRAGVRAINAVMHQNADFLAALDHGAPLQSQQFETKQFADLFYKKMQDELGDAESSKVKELAAALGMAPVRLVQAIYKFSGKVTWYTNDIAFMQSTYEKMDRGMGLKDALIETGKHIPDYRKMTRIFDNPMLAKIMFNPVISMFGAYHYGALKSYGQVLKSMTGYNWHDAGTVNEEGQPTNAAGRTERQEKLHGYEVAAMIGLVTFLVYPLLDKLWKEFTGNDKAQMRRAGASTFVYNLAMLAKGEKTPEEVLESIVTPAVPLKTAAELAFNRDVHSGQRVYNPHAPVRTVAQQVGRKLVGAVAPVDQGLRLAEGQTDWKKMMYSMIGVSFPLHGAQKIAAQINAEKMASLPPEDEHMVAHYVARSRALHDAWAGDSRGLDAIYASPDYTGKEKRALHKYAVMPPLAYAIRNMSYVDAVRVYNAATQEEKKTMQIPLARKLANLRKSGKAVPEETAE